MADKISTGSAPLLQRYRTATAALPPRSERVRRSMYFAIYAETLSSVLRGTPAASKNVENPRLRIREYCYIVNMCNIEYVSI